MGGDRTDDQPAGLTLPAQTEWFSASSAINQVPSAARNGNYRKTAEKTRKWLGVRDDFRNWLLTVA